MTSPLGVAVDLLWPVNRVNHTSWVAVVTPTDRPKSVRNRCFIEFFCGVVCVVTLPFWHFCWCRGFCHRTGSDLLLFAQNAHTVHIMVPESKIVFLYQYMKKALFNFVKRSSLGYNCRLQHSTIGDECRPCLVHGYNLPTYRNVQLLQWIQYFRSN